MKKIGYKHTERTKQILREKNTKIPPKVLKEDENLAYILGTIEGDGYISKNGVIGLGVIDKDFALVFKKSLKKWSGFITTSRNYVLKDSGKTIWLVELYSKFVATHLKKYNLNKIKKFINISEKYKKKFLRGIYDSEGCVPKDVKARRIIITNQNKILLQFCKDLLSDLGIKSGKIIINHKKGDMHGYGHYKKNYYELNICKKENLIKFKDLIKFNIKRKQDNLVKMIDSYLTKKQLYFFLSLPNHKRKNWRKLYK